MTCLNTEKWCLDSQKKYFPPWIYNDKTHHKDSCQFCGSMKANDKLCNNCYAINDSFCPIKHKSYSNETFDYKNNNTFIIGGLIAAVVLFIFFKKRNNYSYDNYHHDSNSHSGIIAILVLIGAGALFFGRSFKPKKQKYICHQNDNPRCPRCIYKSLNKEYWNKIFGKCTLNIHILLKAIIHKEKSDDPLVASIQSMKGLNRQDDLYNIIQYLKKEAKGMLKTSIDEFENSINKTIDIEITKDIHPYDVACLLEVVRCSVKPIKLRLHSKMDGDFSLMPSKFSDAIESLSIENLNISELPSSFWNVRQNITLRDLNNIKVLPDIETDMSITEPLRLNIQNSSIEYLPRTIARRKMSHISLKACKNISFLPHTLTNLIKDKTLLEIELTGTGICKEYNRNIVLTDQLRSTICNSHNTSRLFSDQSTSMPTYHHSSHNYGIYSGFSHSGGIILLIAFVGFLFYKNKHHSHNGKYSRRSWFPYILSAAFVAIALGSYSRRSSTSKQIPYKNCLGNNVDGVFKLINKKCRECINGVTYDWDRLWRNTFDQEDIYASNVPEPLYKFVNSWMQMRACNYSSPLSQCLWKFAQNYGGLSFVTKLSEMPFNEMIDVIEKKARCFPIVLDAIRELRSSIGHPKGNFRSIYLAFQDIFQSDNCVPDPDLFLMNSYFAMITTGYHINLYIDWSYYMKKQPLFLEWIPLCSNIDVLHVKNAEIGDLPEKIWHVKEKIIIDSCIGFGRLSDIPLNAPKHPLTLEFIDSAVSILPHNIQNRALRKLIFKRCRELTILPYNIKKLLALGKIFYLGIEDCPISKKMEITPDTIKTFDKNKLVFEPEIKYEEKSKKATPMKEEKQEYPMKDMITSYYNNHGVAAVVGLSAAFAVGFGIFRLKHHHH